MWSGEEGVEVRGRGSSVAWPPAGGHTRLPGHPLTGNKGFIVKCAHFKTVIFHEQQFLAYLLSA